MSGSCQLCLLSDRYKTNNENLIKFVLLIKHLWQIITNYVYCLTDTRPIIQILYNLYILLDIYGRLIYIMCTVQQI